MKIQLKLEGNLKKILPPDADAYELLGNVSGGCTVGGLLEHLGLEESQVTLAFVDGEVANLHSLLKDGCRVTLCPFLCGG